MRVRKKPRSMHPKASFLLFQSVAMFCPEKTTQRCRLFQVGCFSGLFFEIIRIGATLMSSRAASEGLKSSILCLLVAGFLLGTSPRSFASGVVTNCTDADLRAALQGGGTVTFACDGTIVLTRFERVHHGTRQRSRCARHLRRGSRADLAHFDLERYVHMDPLVHQHRRVRWIV